MPYPTPIPVGTLAYRRAQVAKVKEEPFGDGSEEVVVADPTVNIGTIVPDSWEDIVALIEEQGATVITFEGSPWDVVDKATLVGKEFMVAGVNFSDGKFGPMVSVRALLRDGTKIVFNDGSTGVFVQFKEMIEHAKQSAGLLCPKGLRVSEYEYVDLEGKETPAKTYYVA